MITMQKMFSADKSLRMLIETASYNRKLRGVNVHTFEDLAFVAFGGWGKAYIMFGMFILAYGAMVSYLLIIKQNLPVVITLDHSLLERDLVLLVATLLVILPLSCMRDISQLAFSSLLSIAAVVFLVLIVAIEAPVGGAVATAGGLGRVLADNWVNGGIFVGLGIISFAFVCQHQAFLNFHTLKDKSPARWSRVSHIALIVSTLLTMLLGIPGYLGFLEETDADILNNFDPHSPIVNAARGLLVVSMLLTFPIEVSGTSSSHRSFAQHGTVDL